jgi:hypothetical protein
MSPAFVYLLSHALLVPLGAAAAFHPSVRDLPVAARCGVAFGSGAILLTIEAMLTSLVGLPWSVVSLSAPLLALSAVTALAAGRRREPPVLPPLAHSGWRPVTILALAAVLLALVHLSLSLATARSTSVDFLFFWGVKAARFAEAKMIHTELLAWPYFSHAVPEYPPLVPVTEAFSVLAAGEMPWRRAPIASMFWFAAALPLVYGLLRRRLGGDAAAGVTAFWGAALSTSLAHSISGGNAEAPLLFFETVAGGALLAEEEREAAPSRFLPALAMAGAVLTKVEAVPALLFLVAGTLLRDRLQRRPAVFRRALPLIVFPALALGSWFAFQWISGLPVGYRGHGPFFAITFAHLGSIAREFLRYLNAGTFGLSWILPLAFLAASRRFRPALPGLALAAGLLGFLAFDYLHDVSDPAERIGWTLPRVSQPALSLTILAAGIVFFSGRGAASPGKESPLG